MKKWIHRSKITNKWQSKFIEDGGRKGRSTDTPEHCLLQLSEWDTFEAKTPGNRCKSNTTYVCIQTCKNNTKYTYIFFPAKRKCILLGNPNGNKGGTKYIAHMILFRFGLWVWSSLPKSTNKRQSIARSRSHSYFWDSAPSQPPANSLCCPRLHRGHGPSLSQARCLRRSEARWVWVKDTDEMRNAALFQTENLIWGG